MMLSKWFPKRPVQKPIETPSTSAGSRLYAIGDIHGSLGPLRSLHELILAHAEAHPIVRKTLVYLGDYVDRGMDSRAVLDLLIARSLPGFDHVFLKGNHEHELLRFLAEGDNPRWLKYGGTETIYSYGAKPPDPPTDSDAVLKARVELASKIPPEHLRFLTALKSYYVDGDYVFVHAGVRPGVPLEKQSEADLLSIREEFLNSPEAFEKIVVHGHSISYQVEFRDNRIGIDTGAFASGHLTCLVLEGTAREILSS
jgi:diadenosine tetraphosphatase ApaH/serine/threonine PP2A family protein phosphatase